MKSERSEALLSLTQGGRGQNHSTVIQCNISRFGLELQISKASDAVIVLQSSSLISMTNDLFCINIDASAIIITAKLNVIF